MQDLKSSTKSQIKERIAFIKKDICDNDERIKQFTPTMKIDHYIYFDDNHQYFAIPKGFFTYKIDKSYVFNYDEILDFALIADDAYIAKGTSAMVAFNTSFGMIGVMDDTPHKIQETCKKLAIKITTKNIVYPKVYIHFFNMEIKKEGSLYKHAFKNAQKIVEKLTTILDKVEEIENKLSVFDEIKQYKELLDMNIITKEEFERKKNQLLNL